MARAVGSRRRVRRRPGVNHRARTASAIAAIPPARTAAARSCQACGRRQVRRGAQQRQPPDALRTMDREPHAEHPAEREPGELHALEPEPSSTASTSPPRSAIGPACRAAARRRAAVAAVVDADHAELLGEWRRGTGPTSRSWCRPSRAGRAAARRPGRRSCRRASRGPPPPCSVRGNGRRDRGGVTEVAGVDVPASRSRLRRIAAASTCSPPSARPQSRRRARRWRRRPDQRGPLRVPAPAPRCSSGEPAASSVATRPGACAAAARAVTAAIGFCLCAIDDEPPGAASRTSPTSVWASSTMSPATLPIAAAAVPSAPASSVTRLRSVCHGTVRLGQAELVGEARDDGRPVRVQRRERARRRRRAAPAARRAPDAAEARSRPVEPGPHSRGDGPNVVGTACCSSVRPAMACRGGRGRASAAAVGAVAQLGEDRRRGRGARRASSAVSRMSWLVAPRCTRGARPRRRRGRDRARSSATSGMTGLPPAAARLRRARPGRAGAARRHAAPISSAAARSMSPARATPGPAPPRPRSSASTTPRRRVAAATRSRRTRRRTSSDAILAQASQTAKNDGLVVALEPDVEAQAAVLGGGDERAPGRAGSSALQHRVGRVGLRLVGEVDAGSPRGRAGPRAKTETARCGACAARRRPAAAGLHGAEPEPAVGVGGAAAERREARGRRRHRAGRPGGRSGRRGRPARSRPARPGPARRRRR